MKSPTLTNLPRPNTPEPETPKQNALNAAANQLRIKEIQATLEEREQDLMCLMADFYTDADEDVDLSQCLLCQESEDCEENEAVMVCSHCASRIKRLRRIGFTALQIAAQQTSKTKLIEFVMETGALEDELAALILLQNQEVHDA